ncbi:MAG: hypothetical protein GF313_12600 [Caldithrix sp.]|nr:hypothetical protein [Caldithrix sp.]
MQKIWFIMFALLISACTENFLFNDDEVESGVNNDLSGRIILSDESSRDSVAVWLEGFNKLTWTNDKGNFALKIPDPTNQPGNGLNGIYNLYFFLANFELSSVSVLIRDGELQRGFGEVNQSGELITPQYLQKMITIKTTVTPNTIENTYKDPIYFTVTLQNVVDSVKVSTYKRPDTGGTSCIVIKKRGEPLSQAILLRGTNTLIRDELITEETEWRMAYQFTSGFFEKGEYEILPYIIVEHKNTIPQELISTLGDDVYNFTSEYLKIPFKQESALLSVNVLEN